MGRYEGWDRAPENDWHAPRGSRIDSASRRHSATTGCPTGQVECAVGDAVSSVPLPDLSDESALKEVDVVRKHGCIGGAPNPYDPKYMALTMPSGRRLRRLMERERRRQAKRADLPVTDDNERTEET